MRVLYYNNSVSRNEFVHRIKVLVNMKTDAVKTEITLLFRQYAEKRKSVG